MTEAEKLAALDRAATKMANRCEGISHAIHDIADRCEDEGDRVYLGSTNDAHSLLRQARELMAISDKLRTGKLVLIGPDAVATVGMALCQSALGPKACPCVEKGEFRCSDAHPGDQARAALAALGVKP